MVFKTRRDAQAYLRCCFSRKLAAIHTVIRATRDGVAVGWMIQLKDK